MSFTAAGHKHLARLWQSKTTPWRWVVLALGTAQRHGVTGRWCYSPPVPHLWQFHVTPIHVSREPNSWSFGLCWGARTVYVKTHR